MAADTPAVPFWLQVLAISLAPFLGFLGVAIGVYLQARSNRKLALRAHRQDVYLAFLDTAHEFATFADAHIEPALSQADLTELDSHLDEFSQLSRKIRDLYLQIEVIGSAVPSKLRANSMFTSSPRTRRWSILLSKRTPKTRGTPWNDLD